MTIAALLAELQRDYIKTIPDKVQTMEGLWKTGKIDLLEDEFHKIKGTGKSYGLPEVSVLGEAMERICQLAREKLNDIMPHALTCLEQIHRERTAGSIPDLHAWPEFSPIQSLRQSLEK